VFYTTTWVVAGNNPSFSNPDELVPGDGLFEKDSKTEGVKKQRHGNGPEVERSTEQDITMAEAQDVVA
jgi:ubiquitin